MDTDIAVKNRKRAKAVERRIAKKLGGVRVGILGKEDVLTERFSVEVKSRKSLALVKWFEQAEKNASKRRIPLLVLHKMGSRRYFAVVKLEDFMELLNQKDSHG